jgi:hypothetical protein
MTLPGIVTAIAGLVTAVTGLLVVLDQTGVIGADKTPDDGMEEAISGSPAPGSTGTTQPAAGDRLAGIWVGTAAPAGGGAFDVRLEIAAPCRLEEPCGTITVSSLPCTGRVTLWSVQAKTFEFYVDKFTRESSPQCTPGAGDFFELVGKDSVEYTTGYADVTGELHRVS